MNSPRLKVLLSSYGCAPGAGSEPGVGWNWLRQLARTHDIWLITQTKYRSCITDALKQEPLTNIQILYCELPRWANCLRNERGESLYYYLWQILAYFVARKLYRQFRFDLVHHVSLVRYWMPSLLALLPAPFIWGPVGGGDATPPTLMSSLSIGGRLRETVRNLAVFFGELDPLVRLTAKNAELGLATTQLTKQRMESLGCRRVLLCSEVALSIAEQVALTRLPIKRNGPTFRLLSVGRLIPWKGYSLSLRAFALLLQQFPDSEYWLAGDGPERQRLESLTVALGIETRVRFLGSVPRSQIFRTLAECDVFIHPSLHDSGGWACLEGMAAGRPVVCLDWAGPGVQVTEKTGIKVQPGSPNAVVAGLFDALHRLASDSDLRQQMGHNGRHRIASDFDWDRRGTAMLSLYESVLASTGKTPGSIGISAARPVCRNL